MNMLFRRAIIFYSAMIFALFFGAQIVSAIEFTPPSFKDLSYQGAYAGQSVADPITMEAGSTKEVIVKIKNTGTAIWYPTGANYVSVYTVNPNYRASVFADSSWLAKSQPAKITATTKPSEIAEIKIKLTAPDKTGDYQEDFYLAAENLTWIKSSYFYLKIKVTAPSAAVQSPSVSNVSNSVTNGYVFTRDLEFGMTGADIKELQKFLNAKGFVISATGAGSVGNETTLFGALTKNALIKFQIANKISPAVGYFGPLTRSAVNKLNTAVVTPASSADNGDTAGNSTEGVQDEAMEISNEYKANLVAFSSRQVSATGGTTINFKVRYRNNGTVEWNNYLWQEAGSMRTDSGPTAVERFTIADSNWQDEKKIFEKNAQVNENDVMEIDFTFRAPKYKGEYIARFQLTANGHTLDGGILELPVSVTSDAPAGYAEPSFTQSYSRALVSEPKIRVGLFKSSDPVDFSSPFVYQVWSGEILRGELPVNEKAEVKYFDGLYTFTSASLSFTCRDKIRLVPRDSNSYFVIDSYSRLVSWKGSKNFNAYRNIFEYVYSNKSATTWVVNELPLDEYVAGIGETSNGAAMEYIKAILVAARSYAYYHMNNGVPADQRTYDVVATTVDQLYLGYNSEVLMPRVVQAARVTYGEMVTHGGTPVVTPYFANSDGKTRGWKEVWGGTDKPWTQSVDCVYDIGKTMHGHGVGMSAQDAAMRADKDAWTYDQLLKYYYTGVSVERIY